MTATATATKTFASIDPITRLACVYTMVRIHDNIAVARAEHNDELRNRLIHAQAKLAVYMVS